MRWSQRVTVGQCFKAGIRHRALMIALITPSGLSVLIREQESPPDFDRSTL